MANSGEAYGFLKYGGRIEDILEYIPLIRTTAQTPSELSLQIIGGAENLDTTGDSGLAELVELAKGANLNYVFKANLPDADNKRVAGLLGNIMDDFYASTLYNNEQFRTEIAYRDGKEYKLIGE